MSTTRQWLLILLIAGIGAMAGYWLARPKPVDCKAATLKAMISERAAQICTEQLVGCSLSHEQLKEVLADQAEAVACK